WKSFGRRANRPHECGPKARDPYKLIVFFVTSCYYDVDFVRHREESMVAIAREDAPGRWRASAGRYFEDYTVGDVYEHRPGRTISEADNTWFTLLTMNQ